MAIIAISSTELDDQIAIIELSSGKIKTPTWSSLYEYWSYADPNEIEYVATSYTSDNFVLGCTVASGQGGIIAVWDADKDDWIHVSEANYVTSALLLEEVNKIISLHYVSYYGVPAHHEVYITPITGILNGTKSVSELIEIPEQKSGFNPENHQIDKFALGDHTQNDHGPLGLFYSKEEQKIYAHDAGNLLIIDTLMIT